MNVGVEGMSVIVPLGKYYINCMRHEVHHCESHIDLSSMMSDTFWEWFRDCASYIYLKYNNSINQCYFLRGSRKATIESYVFMRKRHFDIIRTILHLRNVEIFKKKSWRH